MSHALSLTGQRFGRLLVIHRAGSRYEQSLWHCVCDCGKECDALGILLMRGSCKSCGCLRSEIMAQRKITHNRSKTLLYGVWLAMRRRCTDPKNKSYSRYGERGIRVCDEWNNSFQSFLSDMGECPKGMSLERVNNSKGYFKENCRWATPTEQSRNTRRNVWLTAKGKTQLACDWARELKMSQANLYGQLRRRTLEQVIANRMVDRA